MHRCLIVLVLVVCSACAGEKSKYTIVEVKQAGEILLECEQLNGVGVPDILRIDSDGKHAENLSSKLLGTVNTTAAEYVFTFPDGDDQFVMEVNRYTHLGSWELRPHGRKVALSPEAIVRVKCEPYKGKPL